MRLLFVCLLTFLVEISDSALRDSFTKHSWWHVWIFLLIFRRSGTHSSCQVPGLYADWSVVCSVHHSAATFFLLGGWNLVCEVVVLMHANTVWLFIKRQTFLAASVTQNMSVPPAQQVYCPAVQHKSELHPGFVLLFWCFFHEWDGYIVNGFFSVLTVFTAFISEFASAVDSVSARGVLFWKLTVCSVPFLCLTSGLAQSAIFLTDVKWSCVILHPSKIDSVHVLRVDLLLKRSLTII